MKVLELNNEKLFQDIKIFLTARSFLTCERAEENSSLRRYKVMMDGLRWRFFFFFFIELQQTEE